METCPPPGKIFSTPTIGADEARSTLESICQSVFVSQLHELLGASSNLSLVGGTVRDVLLGDVPADLDLASAFLPNEVEKKLTGSPFRVIRSGLSHGTVLLLHREGKQAELTTFRKPGPRDTTEFSETLEEDLSGRDFTINAIAFHCDSLNVVDPFRGQYDLEKNILRAVGEAEDRFNEDPLRILRMIRFGTAEGRTIDSQTLEVARSKVPLLEKISPERVRDEVFKTLLAPFASQALRQYLNLGVFEVVLPEILPSVSFEQNRFHSEDVFEHTLSVLEKTPLDLVLRLAALFHDLGKPHTLTVDGDGERHFYKHEHVSEEIALAVMERFHSPRDETRSVGLLVRHHMRPLDCGEAGVRRILRDLGTEFERWLLFKRADSPPLMPEEEFEAMFSRFREMVETERRRSLQPAYGKLAVDGNDLISLGLSPGPTIGRILSQLEEIVIEDPTRNTQEELLRIVREQELISS